MPTNPVSPLVYAVDLAAAAEATKETVKVAESARKDAEIARLEAALAWARDRRETELARERERLVTPARLVEDLFAWAASESGDVLYRPLEPWMTLRNQIRQASVGVRSDPPKTASILSAGMASQALAAAGDSRFEIEAALKLVDQEAIALAKVGLGRPAPPDEPEPGLGQRARVPHMCRVSRRADTPTESADRPLAACGSRLPRSEKTALSVLKTAPATSGLAGCDAFRQDEIAVSVEPQMAVCN